MSWFSFVVILSAILLTSHLCYGQSRRPTEVVYDDFTVLSNIDGSSDNSDHEFYQVLYILPDDGILVVGEKSYVETFSLTDVSTAMSTEMFSLMEDGFPSVPCLDATKQDTFQCQNYMNVIKYHDGDGDSEWYYCGTNGISPRCWICADQNCAVVEAEVRAKGLVTAQPKTDQPFGFSDGVVFGAGEEKPSSVNRESQITYRNLEADGTFGDDTKVTTDTANLDWIERGSTNIGDVIEYPETGGEKHMYFFFRERATEYQNADKTIYSRVARVCSNDQGGDQGSLLDAKFTTFLKARLNCSVTGLFPFNYDFLQDVYVSPRDANIIYAAFTTTPLNGQANSAVCVYRMDEIAAVFSNSKFKGHNPKELWLPVDNNDVPTPRPGTCTNPQPEANYGFIDKYVLMDQAVPNKQDYNPSSAGAFDRDSDPPVMVLDGLYVTEIIVHEDVCGKVDVFFLGTEDGKVYKAFVSGSGNSAVTKVIEEIDLDPDTTDEVLSMEIHAPLLYVGTVSSLHAIPLSHCGDYSTYQDCIKGQDPYCTWSGSACTSACGGEQCLDSSVFSCTDRSQEWPSPECLDETTLEPSSCEPPAACATDNCEPPDCNPEECQPDFVLVPKAELKWEDQSRIEVNAFVRATPDSVWEETTFSCPCGCPPIDTQQTIQLLTADADSMQYSYLTGVYIFDMSSCNTDVDITITFKANGNTATKKVSVHVDDGDIINDTGEIADVYSEDEKISAYYYQTRVWKQSQARNAESVFCYNCP